MTTSVVDERFRGEAQKFNLRFCCQDCAHFAPETRACGNGYPTQPHLEIDLQQVPSLEFCKDFEVA
jgi:hypothetical protein